ncbi:DoxX family protein [Candidatus Nitrosotenuis uzonensis]|uniref:DoxX family protein n=1 Tax=Candidatus Nitrosotenuis uzonensis TaxID=1407055 RepID=A0A812F1A8_9ARCH|nr:DoxX family protein [Candidatus Nitrosotenuis uzonensis]CAE6500915.1 DoxX family protein [Candidatus Nitrosotenuis uzonensis]
MLVDTTIKENKLHDITHWGIRASIGAIFIFHSIKKFDPSWQQWLINNGLPAELQLPIALAEFLGGIFLISGIFTRITGSIFSVILLGAIFKIKGLDKFAGGQFTGWEFDLVMLAACLMIIITGPGKASISHLVKRIPRFLQ